MSTHQKLNFIAIMTFNRAPLLAELFNSIRSLIGLEQYRIIIFQQVGSDETSKLIELNKDLFFEHVQLSPTKDKVEEKIAENRLRAYQYIFEEYNGESAIVFEDDVVLSNDTLLFFSMALTKFSNNQNFMGVNFGSVEPPHANSENEYFLQRFGIHGPASGLTRRTWLDIKPHLEAALGNHKHFDVAFEFFLRRGFMVTPSRSRYLDLGANGTHAGSDDLPYFSGLRESWLRNPNSTISTEWSLAEPSKPFRDDCFVYRSRDNLFFKILWRLRLLGNSGIGSFLFKLMYKFVYLPKCYRNAKK